jgi:hypothetical protein
MIEAVRNFQLEALAQRLRYRSASWPDSTALSADAVPAPANAHKCHAVPPVSRPPLSYRFTAVRVRRRVEEAAYSPGKVAS